MTKIVCLDAGHGGHDGGAQANGLKEKDLTLDIAKRMQSKLKNYNVKVVMTRTSDKYLTLTERANIANRANADLFISVHINAGGGTGFETFIYNGTNDAKTKQLQNSVHNGIMKQIGGVDRGKKSANFAVVRQTKMPAVLTENLFIDRKEDAAKLKDSKFIDKVAQGHVDGIVAYLGLKKRNTSSTNKKPTTSSNKKPQTSNNTSKKGNQTTNSVVVYLQSIGQPFSFAHRSKLAKQYGIKNYKGSSVQNLMLLDYLRKGKKPTNNTTTSNTSSFKGKRVESKVNGLRFYNKPSWADKDVVGHVNKGVGFPTIVSKHKVGKGYQYKVRNSKGKVFYITANSKYVKVNQ